MLRRLIFWLQSSPPEAEQESFKKLRRSSRLSQRADHDAAKSPVQTNNHRQPSPVTHPAGESTSDVPKEATATPPESRPGQAARRPADENHSQGHILSSQPQDTQAFSQQDIDPNAPLSDEVEDEVKEGVWGYLFPLDTGHSMAPYVLRKKGSCPAAEPDADPVATITRKGSKRHQKASAKGGGQKSRGLASGGYLIGRHPECGT